MDQDLNIARDFLLEEINGILSKSTNPTPESRTFIQISSKIIMMLGILRSNVEDYLIILKICEKL